MVLVKHYDSLQRELPFILYGFILSLKYLLIRCYHSTDFEVHRNWMAITYHRPLFDWYQCMVSEWTLDYPPFFAYLEYMLARIAALFDIDMLVLQKDAYFSENILLYQRLSVIILDAFYARSCWFIACKLVATAPWQKPRMHQRVKTVLFVLLLSNPVLILLDNVHFQYNSLMYSLLFASIGFILAQEYLLGAFLFAVLLNFKHIFLYYVPAFMAFYVYAYLVPIFSRRGLLRTISLASVLGFPLLLAFGPFLYAGGISGVEQILHRLFPFKRGLTHAYWAPNFWALYNAVDFAAYKLLSIFTLHFFGKKSANFVVPQYTRGLVMEYEHSVLPNITPTITLITTAVSCLPIIALFRRQDVDLHAKFLQSLALSAFAFFFFGWHVHEKAILMIFLPMLLLVFKEIRYLEVFNGLLLSTIFSCFPLFFTPLENLLKLGMGLAYLVVHVFIIHRIFRLSFRSIFSGVTVIYTLACVMATIYESFLHRAIFGDQGAFVPLAVFSLLCSIGVLTSYVQFLFSLFANNVWIWWLKRRCEALERDIRCADQLSKNSTVESVSFIAGVDISACVEEPSLAIASLTVLNAKDFSIVETIDKVVLLPLPYIPEYLAIREAWVMADLVNTFIARTKSKLDVVFVDGNGKYHSRRCGLACHVGYLTGTKSVGVTKTFTPFPLHTMGYSISKTEELAASVKQLCREAMSVSILEIGPTGERLLNVLRSANNNAPLFISAGFGLSLETATLLSVKFLSNSIVNPIRLSDLRSRALLQALY